jgi:hypothetical protein
VVSSPPATEETGAMGREIESRQCIGWKILFCKKGNKKVEKLIRNYFEAIFVLHLSHGRMPRLSF